MNYLIQAALLSALVSQLTCCNSSQIEATPIKNQYENQYRDYPYDLFARIYSRMMEPYILAGEDVEMLYIQTNNWLIKNEDDETVIMLSKLPMDQVLALKALYKLRTLPNHPKTKAYLNRLPVKMFPAELVDV